MVSIVKNIFVVWLLGLSSTLICQNIGHASDCEIVNYSTYCKINGNKLIVEKKYEILINNSKGDWITEVSIPYSKKNNIESLDGWLTDKHGNKIKSLKKKNIVVESDISGISLYEDDYTKTFSLRHHTYPYTLHYTYKQDYNEYIYISYWIPILSKKAFIKQASLTVDVPVGFDLKYYQLIIDEPIISKLGDRTLYKWSVENISKETREPYSAPVIETTSKVVVIPQKIDYGIKGSLSSWESYGNWHYRLNQGTNDLSEAEREKVKSLVKGVEDPREKARVLYHYLQDNCRYINVTIDIGGLRPYPASYVAEKKYGDCKALSVYLQAMLEEVNVESVYTAVYAGRNPVRVNEDIVGPQFNHVLLFVPFENDTLWLEATDGNGPFGYSGTFTAGRKALAIKESGSRLINIPNFRMDDVLEKREVTFVVEKNKSCLIDAVEKAKGRKFEKLHAYYHNYSGQKLEERIREDIIPFKSFELENFELLEQGRDDRDITFVYSVMVRNYIKDYAGSLIIPVMPINVPKLGSSETRESPVRIDFPIYKIDSLIFDLSNIEYNKVRLPESNSIQTDYGKYEIECVLNGKLLSIKKVFELKSGNYSEDKCNQFLDFVNTAYNLDKKSVIILE